MDWFVCGNFASISCGTWLVVWNGAIGAAVAAFVGGMVALMVVRLTNSHQSKLAARGRAIAAIADFNAAILAMPRTRFDPREVVQSLVKQAEAAAHRMIMDMDDLELAEELALWPLELGSMAVSVSGIESEGDDARAWEGQKFLRRSVKQITDRTTLWTRTPRRESSKWAAELYNERMQFSDTSEGYRRSLGSA